MWALIECLGCLFAAGVIAGTVQPFPLQLYEGYPDLQLGGEGAVGRKVAYLILQLYYGPAFGGFDLRGRYGFDDYAFRVDIGELHVVKDLLVYWQLAVGAELHLWPENWAKGELIFVAVESEGFEGNRS